MSNLSGNKIALIGGAGFIGHQLALKLKMAGATVAVIDSLVVNNVLSFIGATDNPNQELYSQFLKERIDLLKGHKIDLIVQDAREYAPLCQALGKFKPNIIIQLAAVAHANLSNKDPFSTFDHSLRTLENALDWARGGEVDRFVFFSSSELKMNFFDIYF